MIVRSTNAIRGVSLSGAKGDPTVPVVRVHDTRSATLRWSRGGPPSSSTYPEPPSQSDAGASTRGGAGLDKDGEKMEKTISGSVATASIWTGATDCRVGVE